MQLPRGGLVGVLGQDPVQELSHHLHHLAGWREGPQEGFLHLGHPYVEDSEILICGGSREGQAGQQLVDNQWQSGYLILQPTDGKPLEFRSRLGLGDQPVILHGPEELSHRLQGACSSFEDKGPVAYPTISFPNLPGNLPPDYILLGSQRFFASWDPIKTRPSPRDTL